MTDAPVVSGGTTTFRLDDLTVDPDMGVIRGAGGSEAVDPKVMAVLVELARAPGRVVSRDELLERIWKTECVGDDVVSRCIYCLRGHFEAAGGDRSWRDRIHTLPRRGYLLDASVEPLPDVDEPDSASSDRLPAWVGAGLLALLLAAFVASRWTGEEAVPTGRADRTATTSIAVMPFVPLGADETDLYLGHGIAESLISLLARSMPNQVIARSSSFAMAEQEVALPEAADRLGVTHVVEGTVRLNDGGIVISAQLIDGDTGNAVWAERWEEPRSALPDLERRIAEDLASALGVPQTEAAVAEPPVALPTGAYIDYLHARYLYHVRGDRNLDRTIELCRRVVAQAPRFADAWALLASAAFIRAVSSDESSAPPVDAELLDVARTAAERALSIRPDHPEALVRLAMVSNREGRHERFKALYLRARRIAPSDPLILGLDAGVALNHGDIESAVRLQAQAVELDPLAAASRVNLAWYLLRAGDHGRAATEARRALSLTEGPSKDGMRRLLFEVALADDRIADARDIIHEIDDPVERAFAESMLRFRNGDHSESDAALARLKTQEGVVARLRLAELHAFRAETEPALAIVRDLGEMIEDTRSNSHRFWLRSNVLVSPYLMELDGHPGWPEWLSRVPDWVIPPRRESLNEPAFLP